MQFWNFIYEKIEDSDMHYVLSDEAQLLPDFVEVLNELLANPFVDTYVTGSNSKFLSKDIITEFRGRGDEVHIFPLTFAEFMQTRNDDVLHAWADYAEYGGLPLVAGMSSEEQKATYLSNLFEETYIKDIVDLSAITSNLHMHCLTRAGIRVASAYRRQLQEDHRRQGWGEYDLR